MKRDLIYITYEEFLKTPRLVHQTFENKHSFYIYRDTQTYLFKNTFTGLKYSIEQYRGSRFPDKKSFWTESSNRVSITLSSYLNNVYLLWKFI